VKLAIISDIHGNLAALEAVLADMEQQQADAVLVGGDLVLGGRQPAEVLDLLAARRWPTVMGNTDAFVLALANGAADRTHADNAMAAWAVARLRPRHLDYLRALPRHVHQAVFRGRMLALMHATPWSIDEIVLPDARSETATRMMREARTDVVAYGHIHAAYQRVVDDSLLLSVGGIAWSNDPDPRPAYSVLTVDATVNVEVRRVAYDVNVELAAIDRSGLPLSPILRRLLRSGGSIDRLKR